MQDRKTAEAGGKRPRAYRGGKKGKKSSSGKKKFFVGWKNKMLVGKKTCRLEKKMSVGEFPLPKTDMSGMSGIPCNARPKNGRGGKKSPRAYRGGKERKKIRHLEKKSFLSVGKTKCWLEKINCPLKKKVGWRISHPKNGHVRNVRNSL